MKTKTVKYIISVISIFFLTLNFSCQKGDTGTPGENGSGNIASRTFTASFWTYSSPNYYVNLSVPEITSSNLNSCATMVYFSIDNGLNWRAVPYTQYTSASNYYMNFSTKVGNTQVTWFYNSTLSSGSNPNEYYSTTTLFKVVVISAALRAINPNIDYKSFNQVKETFNLKD